MLSERSSMRTLVLAALVLAPAAAAHADPAQDARSATAACLSAVIDGAPVGDIDEGPISIRRGRDPASCTVTVSDGAPVVVRDAVMTAITRRSELFRPTLTRWNPQGFASREALCNLSLRRNLNVVVSTGKPGAHPVLVATVFEAAKRDGRCDRDEGLQTLDDPTTAAVAPRPEVAEVAVEPAKAKRRLIPRLPGFGRQKD